MTFDPSLHAARRREIAARMAAEGGGVMLLPAAEEKLRNADAEYLFRQDSDHAYVTGLDEPSGCALLYADGRYVLFVRPRDPEKEIWTGRRAGVEGAKAAYGATEAYPVGELDQRLPALLDGAGTLWFSLGREATWDVRVGRVLCDLRSRARAGARAPLRMADPALVLHELRLVKSEPEVRALRKAAEITAEAHLAAMRDGQPGRREYQVQAEIEYAFRRRGGTGPGYGTIVAAGPNATILHYRASDAPLKDGEVCLVDAGAEYDFYTADVSRTFPISGSFTKAQRAAYEVVLDAQVKAIEEVKPGATLDAIHDATVRRLIEGMLALGLLRGTVDERLADKSYRKYYMHRTSHWLGMDVHDVGAYFLDGRPRPLVPGMVVTIEPGLYVPPDDAAAPEALRGVGIRIEDDVLVTAEGHENLTASTPKDPDEVEACCVR
ncbi:aminopeptidase P N-terminal domain-containing protein [Anaeromyxobacter diazotrophicus]|uniref:Xaa-Pro aminopeptidase n=1 Tax=Anaeromyxobacter diazotrophicus TaxID=2590199 RepID=A0A7I9VHS3_9BACT|nr:aminopeptidase P N-terminal domain-containing protein [Anaeromyxobacter diazotrophicus]GEJ55944.1 Xaa-Pro aminopeptidase [Anaeromyxobacter diazotrophicus]